jgi:hypothetical protein
VTSRKPDTPEHEAKCERCGVACQGSVPVEGPQGGQVAIPQLYCIFYGTAADGRQGCTVYEDRFEKAPWCLHADQARQHAALRLDCPYNFQGAIWGKERVSPEEYLRLWPKIVEYLLSHPSVQPNLTWDRFFAFAHKMDPDYRWSMKVNVLGTVGLLTRTKTSWARLKGQLARRKKAE